MAARQRGQCHLTNTQVAFLLVVAAVLVVLVEIFVDLNYIHLGLSLDKQEMLLELYSHRSATLQHFQLHDPTLKLSLNVSRPWLYTNEIIQKPPAQILLTNYGWNQPDKLKGLQETRGIYTRQLLEGVINHPWFHPTAWEHQEWFDSNLRYYVFLDVDVCLEYNHPHYGKGYHVNSDKEMGRKTKVMPQVPCHHLALCTQIQQALQSPLFTRGYKAILVVPECEGWGINPAYRRDIVNDTRLSLVSISSTPQQLQPSVDQGLVPPPGNPVILNLQQKQAIEQCDEDSRDYLLSFVGAFRRFKVRHQLGQLNNGKDILMVERSKLASYNVTFHETLLRSRFAATPRGDGLFSYRFTEVLSAGSIPVIFADGWVLPFRPELFDWNECVVRIPEAEVSTTVDVLKNMTNDDVCRRRQRCLDIYETYMKDGERIIDGIIQGLERRLINPQVIS